MMSKISFLFCVFVLICREHCALITNETQAVEWLEEYNKMASDVYFKTAEADWAYATNITDFNSERSVAVGLESAKFVKEAAHNASLYDWNNFNETLKRQFMKISDIGTDAMKNETKLKRRSNIVSEMEGIYSKGKVCLVDEECLELEPGLTRLMSESTDYNRLARAWKKWRDASGKKMKNLYEEFVELSNEGIKDLGRNYSDYGAYWRSDYEDPNFEEDVEKLLEDLKPMYQQLHMYAKRRLMKVYGNHTFPKSGHIPAHLLGNMWSQEWQNIYNLLIPFPNKQSVDVTPEMKRQNYTAERMFRTAESFFKSIGFAPMPDSFWNDSMITKPPDRDVVCHASAWDFSNAKDVRIKMCTDINMEDLITIHHEMGHIQYYLQYKHQPVIFRSGGNAGFHEAIGDVMALSVATPAHLQKIGLLDNVQEDEEADINFLMKQALEKIAFLPFGYLIDQWRWSVFRGDTPKANYTKDWWKLRCKYQGISPPVLRTEKDFDPGAKYHVASNTPYIRYFVSFVIQFQFHQALCKAANQTGPLHQCDIYNSKDAGDTLSEMLKLGSSKPWPELMRMLTGSPDISVDAIKSYFKPLTDWLARENANASDGMKSDWTEECPPVADDTEVASQWLLDYTDEAETVKYNMIEGYWNYTTNITDYNQERKVDADLAFANFSKEKYDEAKYFNWRTYPDAEMKRQFMKITDIGTSALDNPEQLKKLKQLQATIEGIYGKGVVQMSSGEKLQIEPGLTRLLATSRNYSELKEAWVKWRDVSGKLMKDKYAEMVALSNKGVQPLGLNDTGEYWRNWYESKTFRADLENLLVELRPLYRLLHGYVRQKLKGVYGAENFPTSGHIPAHLFGNMWAQEWNNIYDILEPYKNKEAIDITPELRRQNYTVERIFKTAEGFYKSLGLSGMTDSFWNDSMLEKPEGREVVCHADAEDFFNHKDFRIKMCTDITMESLVTVHHEMGHIEYFMQYRDQPMPFRDGANPGFHEAIGDVMALSSGTPKHLHTIHLLDQVPNDHENDINFLLKMALEKVAFLPFGYLIDQWRWSVFSGETPKNKYNEKWWNLRCKYQGISPPVERYEEDFDPGAKYHIPANVPYIRYFVSFVVQFQFHQALCKAAGHTGPLYKCDIYNSKEAGKLLGDVLRLGASKPWPEAMKALTGQSEMKVDALMEYFGPLKAWLEDQVKDDQVKDVRGWNESICSIRTFGDEAKDWLKIYENKTQEEFYKAYEVEWKYYTNITDETEKARTNAEVKMGLYKKKMAKEAESFKWKEFKDVELKRRFRMISDIGTDALPNEEQIKQLNAVKNHMESQYAKGKVCLENGTCYKLEPGLVHIMATSRNYDELLYAWRGWRDETGKHMRDSYTEFARLSNEAVKELGYNDTGAYWRSWYEDENFQSELEGLLTQLSPLYENLHTYVRRELRRQYGQDHFPSSGHIPAHLLGNMWAQQWNNIYDLVRPFKNKPNIDISPAMKEKGFNVTHMFRVAEDFFKSLGLKPMPENFWENSMMVRPEGREVVCHAAAWDFYNARDVRIKMCTSVNMEDLVTIHHEMGHIQYFLQYMDQPVEFRTGANPGFHEAIGDVMALSVSTPKHLRKIKLLLPGDEDDESDINFLMKMALEKIAFLPFGYLIDQWRWSVFSGETTADHYNKKWWDLRCKYQGIAPPVGRSEDDFDPGAKYHIPSNYPYIRYFVSYVVQFQFQQALCRAANQTGPLHRCDIYQSKEAGKLLSDMLRLGASKPWPEAMEILTGQRKMDVKPLLEYFSPLIKWLEKENYHERPGWTPSCPNRLANIVQPSGNCGKTGCSSNGSTSGGLRIHSCLQELLGLFIVGYAIVRLWFLK